ncbi:MAG: redoxin family protein [Armatimonadetes bacterium]|nr:redoxin family protein [Armatimonadota bacterium]
MKTVKYLLFISVLTAAITAANSAPEEGCQCKAMPKFSLKGSDGKTYTQDSLTKAPTVVLFLKEGCPHNPKAVEAFNKLRSGMNGKVSFYAVTNATAANAKKMAGEFKAAFPILSDTSKAVVKGFGATRTGDFALLCSDDKRVAKLWNGYSQQSFKELLTALPEHHGPKISMDLSKFPTAKQSGCMF